MSTMNSLGGPLLSDAGSTDRARYDRRVSSSSSRGRYSGRKGHARPAWAQVRDARSCCPAGLVFIGIAAGLEGGFVVRRLVGARWQRRQQQLTHGIVEGNEKTGKDIHADQAVTVDYVALIDYLDGTIFELQRADLDVIRKCGICGLVALTPDTAYLGSTKLLEPRMIGDRTATNKPLAPVSISSRVS